MIALIFALFAFIGSAFAVEPNVMNPEHPLLPGTFVVGMMPTGLDAACKQGLNKRPYAIAPSLPGRVAVGDAIVFSADPNKGGTLITLMYQGNLMSVIPAATPIETDPRTGIVTRTDPVPFWYCLDNEEQAFAGIALAGGNQTVVAEGQTRYLGNFGKMSNCSSWTVRLGDTGDNTLEYNVTRCKNNQ